MALTSGTKLGPYEIQSPLGAGGMGEVYRARDTRLGRDVAIKVLPQHLSSNTQLNERFEREARTISSLNHPHICTLHDVGHQDGTGFLVLEFLEGDTLERRLHKGPLPAKQVLEYGVQISDALDRAHRQGIVHRDLKPGNIMLTKSGVKLMDFGLAKLVQEGSPVAAALDEMTAEDKKLTEEGTIVGTFQYMAPEQLEGAEIDARTDIFALGEVLYEMATGKPAFKGKTKASLIAAILSSEPQSISALEPMVPVSLDEVVKLCLAKDPEQRWQTAHDVTLQLKRIAELGSQTGTVAAPARRRKSGERVLWALALLSLALVAIATRWARPAAQAYPIRFELSPVESGTYDPVISPSGRQIAFLVLRSGSSQIWVRHMDSLQARAVPGTEDGARPFWSPDEQSLGFFARGKLNKVEIATGSVQTLTKVPYGVGGTWSSGVIVYTPSWGSGLFRVPSSGGDAQPLSKLDGGKREAIHAWPQFLPDGQHVLFLQRGATGDGGHISVVALGNKNIQQLMKGDALVGYTEPGYILFVRDGAFMAQLFDASRLRLRGDPFLVADKIGYDANWAQALASVSADGTVVYQEKVQRERQLVISDRTGKQVSVFGPAGPYDAFRVSADEKQVAVNRVDPASGTADIWIFEISRGIFSRLTTNPANNENLTWSPDGRSMVFQSDRNGMYDLYLRDASGKEAPLLQSSEDKGVPEWSRDGKYVVYTDSSPKTHSDIWAIPVAGDRKPFPVVKTEADEQDPRVSPDGRWLAYQSDESGRFETYVVSFPEGTDRLQISNSGGSSPRWSPDGRELFYISGDRKVMTAEVKSGAQLEASAAKPLFAAPDAYYDVVKNGQRFIFSNLVNDAKGSTVNVIVNWTAGLKK
jgi:serine/threonine protein kinase/Tol biopolymer transport system component